MEEKRKLFKVGFVLIAALTLVVFLSSSLKEDPISIEQVSDIGDQATPKADRSLTMVKNFTSAEFKSAFDNLSLPNITPIVIPPTITGNIVADARIQELAEARGYQLRHVASGILNELEGKPVQELLIQDWDRLSTEAFKQGVIINFVSGYRSVDDQSSLFTSRLYVDGATNEGMASGLQDGIINSVLQTVAPPGYSRHHSGYTIDLSDPGFAVFSGSTAHQWLSANNYLNAKTFGFIPSYPEGLTNQGPNPEAWEFVWVGKDITYQ